MTFLQFAPFSDEKKEHRDVIEEIASCDDVTSEARAELRKFPNGDLLLSKEL